MDNVYIREIRLDGDIPPYNYLYDLPVISNLKKMGSITFNAPITFFVGENGIGKSTLIEAIAVSEGFNAEGGTKNYNYKTRSTHSDLYKFVKLIKTCNFKKYGYFLRAESFYNSLSYKDFLHDIEHDSFMEHLEEYECSSSSHDCSHGEGFLQTISEFKPNGLYILDEPESALSPNGLMKLIAYVLELVKSGSQFIISTHSPILLTIPNSEIYELKENEIKITTYDKTEHYTLTRRFLENPEKMIRNLI